MLQALIHNNRHKPDADGAAITLKDDTLTACVFGRLRYVGAHCVQQIFQEIAAHNACTLSDDVLGSFVRLHFWPRYLLNDRNSVEPDIVAEFDKSVIIVESKLDDGTARQSPAHWQQTLASLRTSAAHEGYMVKLVALGGVKHCQKAEDVWFLSWSTFFHIIEKAVPQTQEHERLLVADIRSALELHGVRTRMPVYFNDFARDCPHIQPVQPGDYLQGAMK